MSAALEGSGKRMETSFIVAAIRPEPPSRGPGSASAPLSSEAPASGGALSALEGLASAGAPSKREGLEQASAPRARTANHQAFAKTDGASRPCALFMAVSPLHGQAASRPYLRTLVSSPFWCISVTM